MIVVKNMVNNLIMVGDLITTIIFKIGNIIITHTIYDRFVKKPGVGIFFFKSINT